MFPEAQILTINMLIQCLHTLMWISLLVDFCKRLSKSDQTTGFYVHTEVGKVKSGYLFACVLPVS